MNPEDPRFHAIPFAIHLAMPEPEELSAIMSGSHYAGLFESPEGGRYKQIAGVSFSNKPRLKGPTLWVGLWKVDSREAYERQWGPLDYLSEQLRLAVLANDTVTRDRLTEELHVFMQHDDFKPVAFARIPCGELLGMMVEVALSQRGK